jgi:hypothetical protein
MNNKRKRKKKKKNDKDYHWVIYLDTVVFACPYLTSGVHELGLSIDDISFHLAETSFSEVFLN